MFRNWKTVYGNEIDGKFHLKRSPSENEKLHLTEAKLDYTYHTGYINKQGELVIKTNFMEVYPFSDGLALVKTKDYKYGYIDRTGKIVIKPQYNEAYSFKNGIARVRIKTKPLLIEYSIVLLILILIASYFVKRNNK